MLVGESQGWVPARDLQVQQRCEGASRLTAPIAGGQGHGASVLQKRGVLHDKSANLASLREPCCAGAPEMNTHEHS